MTPAQTHIVNGTAGCGVTAQQEALLASGKDSVPAGARNIRLICTVYGGIDPDLARAAFDHLVERHEMLRTFYSRDMSGAWQCATGQSRCDFDAPGWNELAAMPFENHVDRESICPFDLENGPLLRVRLYSGAADTASLLLCAPFIAADLTSLRILMSEFESVYAALLSGRTPSLPAPRGSYFDYVRQSQRHVASNETHPLSGADASGIPPVDLPFDYRQSAPADGSQGEVHFEVPEALKEQLDTLLTSGRSSSCAFLAAYALLLSRYSAAERIPIALPVSERKPDTRNAIGNYLRVRAAIVECAPQTSFNELIEQVWSVTGQTLDAGASSQSSASAEDCEPDAAAAPACCAWFAWESAGRALRLCSGASFESVEAGCLQLPGLFALGLRLSPNAGSVRGSLVYRRDRFSRAAVERMSRQLLRLLASVCERAHGPIGELEMLPDEERSQVLACAAGPRTKFPALCLHELFRQHATRRPGAEALVFGGERLTYGELDRRSNQVAQFLRSRGLRPQEIVGVCMEPCADWVVALIGILKAGGVYAPIDPKFPAERILFMVEDMAARWVITTASTPMDASVGTSLVYINSPGSGIAEASCAPVPSRSKPDSAAVLIYTSGTTGPPKGTLIPHRSVIRVAGEQDHIQIMPGDRVAQVMNPCFDVCILEVWGALTNGATLIGIPRNDLLALRQTARIMEEERVSALIGPAAYLNQIGRENPGMLGNLKTVIYGGEPADPALIRAILKAGPPRTLINAYGPTEGCIIASCYRIEHLDEDATNIPIGRPLTNVSLYLLDANLRPVPFGVPAEICIGGDIALGYWRRPELTREKFIPDFMGGVPGATFYRTGDMARLRADGNLEFLGRTDQQVKVRGFRIELGAIQIALASHPDVSEAVVIVREDQPGNRRLVAYVKLRRELKHAAEVLRRYAQSRMPEYMIPAAIVQVDSIPLNSNGKVDRAALAVPHERPETAAAWEDPRTELQQTVATLWRELLAVEKVSLNDNFFDLGGDSLLGMRLTVSLRESLGISVALQSLFASATLREFCAALEAAELAPGRLEKVAGILNRLDTLSPMELDEAICALDRN